MDLSSEGQQSISRRIKELSRGSPWTKKELRAFMRRLSYDQRKFLSLLVKLSGELTKEKVMEEIGWKKMKVTGLVAGLTKMCK